MPSSSERACGDSNPHHVPPPGTVAHAISATFRMNQPSSAGTRPVSVSSIFASCMRATLPAGAAAPPARRSRRVAAVRRVPRPVPIAAGVVVLALLWLVRPIFHGLAMFFWTEPLVWLPPVAVLVAGLVILRRSRRGWKTLDDLRDGMRPPPYLLAFPVIAFVLFIVGASLQGPLVGRAIFNATTYEEIGGLPPGGRARGVGA